MLITQSNVSFGNAHFMAHEEWRLLSEPWERLRWARIEWQTKAGAVGGTAKEAAESLGMKEGTYRAYERAPGSSKSIDLDHQAAIRFGKKFKVSWTWLLTGEGSPSDGQLPEPQERVVRAMAAADEEQQRAVADLVERLLKSGTNG